MNYVRMVLGIQEEDGDEKGEEQSTSSSPESKEHAKPKTAEELREERLRRYQNYGSSTPSKKEDDESGETKEESPKKVQKPKKEEIPKPKKPEIPEIKSSPDETASQKRNKPEKPKPSNVIVISREQLKPKKEVSKPVDPPKEAKSKKSSNVKPESPKKSSFSNFHKFSVKICDISISSSSSEKSNYLSKFSQYHSGIDRSNLESAIFERIGSMSENTVLEYLINCLKTVDRYLPSLLAKKKKEKKPDRLEKIESRISDLTFIQSQMYHLIALLFIDNELFPQKDKFKRKKGMSFEFLEKLIFEEREEKFLYSILTNILTRYENDEESMTRIFRPFLFCLRDRMVKADFLDDKSYKRELQFMEWVSCDPSLRKMIVSFPEFLPGLPIPSGRTLEHESFLGPFFGLTCFSSRPNVGKKIFHKVETLSVSELHLIFRQWRLRIKMVNEFVYRIMKNFLKSGHCRPIILNWFSLILRSNENKAKLMDRSTTTSSDGFLNNVCYVMLKLCQPFLDVKKKMWERVDPNFSMSTRLNLIESTKFCMSVPDAKKSFEEMKIDDEKLIEDSSLITQMYFLTMKAVHLGLISGLRKMNHLSTAIRRSRDQMNLYSRLNLTSQAARERASFFDMTVKKWSDETHLVDRYYNDLCARFYVFNQHVILHQINPKNAPGMVLPSAIPDKFRRLPEFFLTDMIDHFSHVRNHGSRKNAEIEYVLTETPYQAFIDLLILILGNKPYFPNPNERSKITDVFISLSPLEGRIKSSYHKITHSLLSNRRAKKYLMECIIGLYIDVERMENSYYLKYKPRHEICELIEKFWKYTQFKQSFIRVCKEDKKVFTHFFNMNINDCTFLLDECITRLKDINEFEKIRNNPTDWNKKTKEEKTQMEQKNANDRNYVTARMSVAKKTVHLLNFVTKDLPKYFARPGLIERIANMLNHFLYNMVETPRQLAVSQRDKLNFKPRELLSEITDIYLHLSEQENFVKAVARDQRSFRPEMFEKACILIQRNQIRSGSYVTKFEAFSIAVLEEKEKNPGIVIPEEEIPDNYLDPLMGEIMEDPVLLPSSNVVIDRKHIIRHLLNNPTDPFTRKHLTEEMLQPQEELKKEIEEFLKMKMGK